jgi:hypothetical protein
MAEKLKSILKQTRWSLVLKAAIFAAAWLVLPFWLFLLVALYLYFVPFLGSAKVALPFLVLLLLSLFEGQNIFFALIFGILFYYILAIKDLLIIDRRSAYEMLVLALSFFLLRIFFLKEGGDLGGGSIVYGFCVAAMISMMMASYIANFADDSVSAQERSLRRTVNWLSFFLMWQIVIAGLFLPLDYLYQTAIIFLASITIIDLLPRYIFKEISPSKIFTTSAVVFTLLVLLLSSARWGL